MQAHNIAQTNIDISVARLSSYRAMFIGATNEEIYGIYCWNEAVSSTLFRLISITEIVMRNRFHVTLSEHLYNRNSSVGRRDANDWYNQTSLPKKSAEKIRDETHDYNFKKKTYKAKVPFPSPNDVVSRMTFGFWPKLLDVALPWEQLLLKIVPGHRYKTAAHWKILKNQDAFYARLDLVNKIRNRIAHFEPVWKQGDLYEERRHRKGSPNLIIEFAKPTSPIEVINRMKLIHDRIVELLKWLSPDRNIDYQNSYIENHFNWLCSNEGIQSYMSFKSGTVFPVSKFKREFNGIMNKKTMVLISRKNKQVGKYYPLR